MGPAPRIAIRVDASAIIGTGHLKRCQSLVQALIEQGAQVSLVTRALDGVAAQVLRNAPCPVHWLPLPGGSFQTDSTTTPHAAWACVSWVQDAKDTADALQTERPDWLVVDHYAFDARWHDAVRAALGCRLLVIDDTADRMLSADALLDHNWALDHRAKYADRLAREPHWLAGPRHALLSPAYRSAPRYRFQPAVRSIGIFMGGTDPDGISTRVLVACRAAGFFGAIEVVSTSANPHLSSLRKACAADAHAQLTLDQPDLAAFFARHDLQIGAGGGATWERCCIGAPTIAIAVAANQLAVVPGLAALGAVRGATANTLPQVLHEVIEDPATRQALGERAAALVDGRGAQRVALHLLRDSLSLRPATLADAPLLHAWRNHPAVRAVSGSSEPITFKEHQAWMQRVLRTPDRWLFVAQVGALRVGSIRFERTETSDLEVSLYTDPQLQGLGLGPRLLRAGEQQMHHILQTPFTVQASVVAGNTASHKLFEGSGYHGGPLLYRKAIRPPPDEPTATP
ncbi:UDP-2,4-diacetamido-2,4,6-trideoxy-beta-L-altropyranose hydrolase [Hydrogenophaga sp.]|uniref:UDP-2,4-diacetamido-2,4, 6-trideoxy-beta-L-altropyranose hydrolase n=1 Tax=Hydrogenophaga sp. TaxID=1904254 RepID=UPI0027206C16|nr:UDP-2,4-diacetamido-2,4,6-trideoxy-beta-L-altropyranose hydrolase [Hydrogenophaga sp.]MDO9135101.1 UDP-2,4-diacetamido-2,4,6-trideoxy-beta-L-altropyranose hydrolase [Hydrogenophaga sp.]MDO9604117.1 UDP-2,4-diacetamido-2,4,6-trideoxy-beta-L-altropyranose hydrolase [Hydrogenophaga sp.]